MNQNSLLSYVKSKISPSEDQANLLVALENFINSESKIFLMKGYAGTGKTTITKYLAEYLSSQKKDEHTSKYSLSLAAFTGRASMILKKKTGFSTTTIHKLIYNFDQLNEEKTGEKEDQKKYKFNFKLLTNLPSEIDRITIIDESSMISNSYSENDFFLFGSGFLLNDLMEFASINNPTVNHKIIFIGDPAQLPPVGEKISKALSAKFILENYNQKVQEYTLTQVMRQKGESGILENATMLRNIIESKKRNTLNFHFNNTDFINLSLDNVIENFITQYEPNDIDSAILINYTNKSSLNFNLQIKERLNKKNELCVGDVLMTYSNNYNHAFEIYNGTMCRLKQIGRRETKNRLKTYTKDQKEEYISLTFVDVVIEVENNGVLSLLECKIIEDFLYTEDAQLNYSQCVALYLDFIFRNSNLKRGTEEFKTALKNDKYLNALRVKFGYAITAHKAQGGEWKGTIVNLDSHISKLSDDYIRFAYTAITRSSEVAKVFNAPNISVFSKFEYKPYNILVAENIGNSEEVFFQVPANFNEILENFQVKDLSYNRLQKFKSNYALANHFNIKIESRFQETEFKEVYTFSKEGNFGQLFFNLKKGEVYSNILKSNKKQYNSDFESELLNLFEQKIKITFVDNQEDKNDTIHKEHNSDISIDLKSKPLYDELSHRCRANNIRISNVAPFEYYDLYTFKMEEESAVIQFHRNKNDGFTIASPIVTKCKDKKILDNLNGIILNFIEEVSN
jgi:hypothetical protein